MATLRWKNGILNYTDEGRGPAVILLHGFCESLALWDDWREDLIDEGQRVIRVDLLGFGATTATGNTITEHADAVDAILTATKVRKGILVGHSMGGYVALALAERNPKWLMGLCLFHSHPYADNAEQLAARRKSIDFIRRNGHLHYVKQLVPRLFARNAGTSASFRRDMIILRASRSSPESFINALEAMGSRQDYADWLTTFNKPVLFINGQNDPIYPPEQRRDQLALPAVADVCLLERAGHMGMIEEPRETQRAVRRFVRFCKAW